MRRWNKTVAGVVTAVALSVATMGHASTPQTAGTNAPAPKQIIAPTQVNLPPVPAHALRMSEAGMSDELIISYVQKSANSYALDAAQIIYLHDLGISSAVLKALVQHESSDFNTHAPEALNGTADEQAVASTVASAATDQATPPINGAAGTFYDALAPYGTWLDLPSYGWCWQPTVVVLNPAWQPYCNNGSWLWTDQGWYWNSYYSWGWAPFHYGRWCRYSGYGWVWCPDDVWGPAWVCWRDYPGYCGWAPLPPSACFTAGLGWTYHGVAVGFNFGFGLGPSYFTFCDYGHFRDRHPFGHFYHGRDADHFFDHSRVHNDFAIGPHHHFINRGINPARIEKATHTRIDPVAVRELPHRTEHSGAFTAPDRLTREGNNRVIYRPGRDISTVRDPALALGNPRRTGGRGHLGASHESVAQSLHIPASQMEITRQNNRLHSAPVQSWNHSQANLAGHQWSRAGNTWPEYFRTAPGHREVARPSSPAPSRHAAPIVHSAPAQRSVPIWHSAPVRPAAPIQHSAPIWRSAPARRSAPIWHAAPVQHSAPAWHAAPSRSRGGGARIGGASHFSGGAAHVGGGRASARAARR